MSHDSVRNPPSSGVGRFNRRLSRAIMILTLLAVPLAMALGGGFQLKEENDYFGIPESDRYYTQGLQLSYIGDPVCSSNHSERQVYGIRNVFYTPTDIEIPAPQPDDRPWAGLTAVSWATERMENDEFVVGEWMLGVVGDWSKSEQIQKEFHKLVHCQKPMGWSNQIPHEVVVNFLEDHTRCMYLLGSRSGFGADASLRYFCALGTAFDYTGVGTLLRAGWKVPRVYKTSPIAPTLVHEPDNEFSGYLFAGADGRYVFHNVMLGGSFFQDGPSQDLERWVGDLNAGLALGVGRVCGSSMDFNFSYRLNWRSKEFVGQVHPEAYGTVCFEVAKPF